jgi:hypothetical protein
MIQRTPEYSRFMQRLTHPYWVFNPFVYRTPTGFGIAHFAETIQPGKFNLAWLIIPPTEDPNDIKTYQRAPLRWAFVTAPKVNVRGRSLIEHASMLTLPEFRSLMLAHRNHIERKVTHEGMSWSQFELLLNRDDHIASTMTRGS